MTRPIALITGASRGLGKHGALALAAKGVDLIITYRSQAAEAEAVVTQARALGVQAHALALDVGERHLRGLCRGGDATARPEVAAHPFQLPGQQRRDRHSCQLRADHGAAVRHPAQHPPQGDLLPDPGAPAPPGRWRSHPQPIHRPHPLRHAGLCRLRRHEGGVEVLTQYLAKELGPRGIAVNVLAPGAIETDFGGGVVRDNKGVNDFLASQTALGRVGQPDDIGGAIAALLSDDCRWITAQRIEASGGMFI